MFRTGKIRTDWRARFGFVAPLDVKTRRRVLLHAVSVGEVNAIRLLVDELGQSGNAPEVVIATTTDTGFARAQTLWSGAHAVVRYPFDFSPSVNRFLNAVDPDVVALVELEVWPNFTAACWRRRIPVCVINGRLTDRSFKRYRSIGRLVRPSFRRLTFVAAQTESYAGRFRSLGISPGAVIVTGNMKWDTAQIADHVEGADELASSFGLDRTRPLVVAGSTAPGEHELLVASTPPDVQLLCAPRKPEWFEQAAAAMPGCVRRSAARSGIDIEPKGRFLLDTIGELRQAYSLADVVVIGRSFGNLHGSDMIEPIALGKPVIVGPAVGDFREAMDALAAGNGVVQTTSQQLPAVLTQLLDNPAWRTELAKNGRLVIRAHQGATKRTAHLIRSILPETRLGTAEHAQVGFAKANPPSRG